MINRVDIIGLALLSLFFSGCASIARYYSVNPASQKIELIDYDGPLYASPVFDMDLERLVDQRSSEDYFLIGSADYTGRGDLDWTGAMVRLGRKLKAEKVDYFTNYLRTENYIGVVTVPTTHNSTATVWGPNGPRSIDITTTGTAAVPYNFSAPRNEFHVLYFKKMKHPLPFGMTFGMPNDEIAKSAGTRNVTVILRVIPGKIAWKNNLFKGDVILEVDGQKATMENVGSFCRNSNGKKMKIRRDGKDLEITIRVD